MNNHKKICTSKPITLGILLCLCIMLLPGWASAAHAFLPAPHPTALLLVKLSDESQLTGLDAYTRQSALSLFVYTRLYPEQGGLDLLLAATPELQQTLSQGGYTAQVLDPDVQNASYCLLGGDPASLQHAAGLTRVLLVEGRLAIARIEPGELEALAGLGLRLTMLAPKPLILPLMQTSAPEIPSAITPNPLVQQMIAQVSSSALSTLDGNLSGVSAVTIGGSPYTIATRNTNTSVPISKATQYGYEYLQSLGLPTQYHNYNYQSTTKRNVIAEQLGATQPGKIFLLIAHVDDTSQSPLTLAPGADDNATGSAAVLHIASILRQYQFGCTLRYALVTGEEQGLYGSAAYAAEIQSNHENLLGVLNLDMLGYNSPHSAATVELDYKDSNDQALAQLFIDAVSAYSLSLAPYLYHSTSEDSDHASFWDNYPAILAIDDWDDHTPYYHTTGDTLSTLNMGYYTELVKAALATFAHMGCLPVVPDTLLSGTVRDQTSHTAIAGAKVEAWMNGSKVGSTTTSSSGAYQLSLSAGSYTVIISAAGYHTATFTNVVINTSQTTQLDAFLTSCITVKGASFQVSPDDPHVGQTVSFTATVTAGEAPISYSWDFGDLSSASGANVTHVYSAQGVYNVLLTADNSCQAPQNASIPLSVAMQMMYLPVQMNDEVP
jgi:hypothetical protein